jgi:Cu+-exporting ATPase
VKDAQALEVAHKLDIIVFDKTGTLTKGKPEVTDFEGDTEYSPLLYSVEKQSHHPLAEAVVTYLEKLHIKEVSIEQFTDKPGLGVEAMYKKKRMLIGTLNFFKKEQVEIPGEYAEKAKQLQKEGKTVSFVAYDKRYIGLFALADTIKEDAKDAIRELQEMHIKTVMITGDNTITAKAVAQALGIDEVLAEVLPGEKASMVKKLQNHDGRRYMVGMVGDGINDAPALAQADVGLAMGTGTDVAIATGDIVLVKGSLQKVTETIKLSRQTLRIIKQNLFWAFGYNVIGIPIAAGMLYPVLSILLSPILASLAMAMSSISVVGNSVRLKYLVK